MGLLRVFFLFFSLCVCFFCTLLFCLLVNELHQIQWPEKPLTMDTLEEIHDAKQKCTFCVQKKAEDAAPSGMLRRQKRESVISNLHMHSNTNDEFLHPWAAFHTKTSCSGWISAGDCDLLIWISLSQVSALHVDIHDWTCRWHQKPSGCNYWLIIATSQIIIRGWQNSGPAWRAIDFPMFSLWEDQENKTWNLLSS